jgi:hypothetical protein
MPPFVNEERHNFYVPQSEIRVMKSRLMRGSGNAWGEEECVLDLVGNPEGKRQLTRTRLRWEYNN